MRTISPVSGRTLLLCAAPMEASFLALHLARNPAQQVAFVLISYLVCGILFGWLLWRLHRTPTVASTRAALLCIVAAGAVFRLTLLPLPPATSQDVQRYLWEGIVRLRGFDPYSLAPQSELLAPLAAEYHDTWSRINHPYLAAIYPPFAQLLFVCNAALFGGSLLGWKLILLLFDALLAAAVGLLLRQRALPLVGPIGVLWCPLLLLESYEGGHLDVIGAALIALALLAICRRRPLAAGLAIGLALNTKYLWPLLILVLALLHVLRHEGGRRALALAASAGASSVAVWLPYRSGLSSAAATARRFAESWTFNDLLFESLRWLPGPRWLPMALVLVALLGLAVGLSSRRPRDVWHDTWLLVGAGLLLGPVAYPWYFLWAVPGLALRPPAWLAVWILTVPALHLVDWRYVATGRWDPMQWLWVVVGLVPGVLLIRAWWQRLKAAGLRDADQLANTA